MNNLWLELKYGTGKAGMTLCRLDDPKTIRVCARTALKDAEERALESAVIDPVLGIIDKAELGKLRCLLQKLLKDLDRSTAT